MTALEKDQKRNRVENPRVIVGASGRSDDIVQKSFKNIPQSLKEIPQWLLCKIVSVPGKAKLKKLPCTVNAYDTTRKTSAKKVALEKGDVANPLNPNSWASFDDAVRLLNGGGHQLLGFVLTDKIGVKVIDMDDVLQVDTSGQLSFHSCLAETIYNTALKQGAYVQLLLAAEQTRA